MKIEKFKISNELLPHRFVYQGDSGGPPEGAAPDEAGEGGGGVSEEAAEIAAEERRQSAKAAKMQKKDEKKIKKRDYKLADIIKSYIHGARRDDKMSILLSRLLKRNTPSTIILAVLSLNYPDIVELLENYLEDERDSMPDDTPADDFRGDTTAIVQYGKELAEALSVWTKRIFTHASFRPMKSIIALAHHHGVDHNMIQLTSLMIQRYFQNNKQEVEFENVKQFTDLFWRDALKRLHQMANERGLLPEPTIDKMEEDEDEDEDDDDED